VFLTARPAVPADLPGALSFIRKIFHIPGADCADVRKMWEQIMLEAECSSHVVEDRDQKEGERIAFFDLTFFVPEPLMDQARRGAPPFLWRWLLERWRQGQPVWLARSAARQTQIEGEVCLFAFIAADIFRYSGADFGRVGTMFSEAYVRELSGHRVRYHLAETYGPAMRDRFVNRGMAVLSDYRKFSDDPLFQALPKEQRPFLMLADFKKAAEDMVLQSTSVGKAAIAGPPRYGFNEAEQAVMKLGLLGLTDQAIAEKLRLSLIAIKKRWEGIYQKVNEKSFSQALERDTDDASPPKIGRRQVLQMVAEHPEEFRPSAPKKRAQK
jgi:DNA-binding CsgD family transcriptional regulator